jgi:hypothetical protein
VPSVALWQDGNSLKLALSRSWAIIRSLEASFMCRNIRDLFNFDPPTTPEEVREAALQYVRKISGTRAPSKLNQAVFERAVDQVRAVSERLLSELVTAAPPKSREAELAKRRERFRRRADGMGRQSAR